MTKIRNVEEELAGGSHETHAEAKHEGASKAEHAH